LGWVPIVCVCVWVCVCVCVCVCVYIYKEYRSHGSLRGIGARQSGTRSGIATTTSVFPVSIFPSLVLLHIHVFYYRQCIVSALHSVVK